MPRKLTDDKRETEAGGSSGSWGGGREGHSESKAGQGGRGGEKRAASCQGKDGVTSEERAPIGHGSFRPAPHPPPRRLGERERRALLSAPGALRGAAAQADCGKGAAWAGRLEGSARSPLCPEARGPEEQRGRQPSRKSRLLGRCSVQPPPPRHSVRLWAGSLLRPPEASVEQGFPTGTVSAHAEQDPRREKPRRRKDVKFEGGGCCLSINFWKPPIGHFPIWATLEYIYSTFRWMDSIRI